MKIDDINLTIDEWKKVIDLLPKGIDQFIEPTNEEEIVELEMAISIVKDERNPIYRYA